MKKLFVLSLLLFTTDSFATGISGGTTTAPCDNATLSKYTGTVNAEINWEPNTINLKWFDGDTELNVANTSQTCTYDGMITVPPQPTKPGYTFNGWKIQQTSSATCGMEQLDTSIKGTAGASMSPTWANNVAAYNLTTNSTWAVEFSYGVVYGAARCSTSDGYRPQIGTPNTNSGPYCWCQATGFTPAGNDYSKGPRCIISPTSSWWVYVDGFTGEGCPNSCAYNCLARFAVGDESGNDDFRPAVFSAIGR